MGITRGQAKALGIPWGDGPRRRTPAAVALSTPLLPAGPRGRWSVEIPGWRPISLNECRNKHWSAEYRAKRATAKVLLPAMLAAGVSRATGRRRISLDVAREDGKHADHENILKLLHDPLKWLGVLVDDGPEHCESGPYVAGAGPTRTIIEVEDLPCS